MKSSQSDVSKLVFYYLFMSLVVSMAGELNFYPFNDAFRISLGMPTFFLFLLLFKELPGIISGIVVGAFVVAFRIILDAPYVELMDAFIYRYPTFFYYFTFGLLFSLTKINHYNHLRLFIGLMGVLFDIFSSVAELTFQLISFQSPFTFADVKNISMVAIFRGYFSVGFFNLITLHEEKIRTVQTEKSNEQLIMVITNLYQESINLRKTLVNSENVTKKAFKLYQDLKEVKKETDNKELANLIHVALEITGESHEIKKDNQRIFSGLSRLTLDENFSEYINVNRLIQIIKNTNQHYGNSLGKTISITYDVRGKHPEYHVYITLSILNNLITNAIEAFKQEGAIHINIYPIQNDVVFEVKDNGPGIMNKYKKLIFEPGFTTKYNNQGTAFTGIGLNYVQETVTNLGGHVVLASNPDGVGTNFKIYLPKYKLVRKG